MFGDTVYRRRQEERLAFFSDVSAAIAGIAGKEGSKAAKEHMEHLESAARED